MGGWIADRLHAHRGGKAGHGLVMGLTFKENVPDLRNSRSIDLVRRLTELGHDVAIADPEWIGDEAHAHYGRDLVGPAPGPFDLVDRCGPPRCLSRPFPTALGAMVSDGGTLADIKGMWRDHKLAPNAGLLDAVI